MQESSKFHQLIFPLIIISFLFKMNKEKEVNFLIKKNSKQLILWQKLKQTFVYNLYALCVRMKTNTTCTLYSKFCYFSKTKNNQSVTFDFKLKIFTTNLLTVFLIVKIEPKINKYLNYLFITIFLIKILISYKFQPNHKFVLLTLRKLLMHKLDISISTKYVLFLKCYCL